MPIEPSSSNSGKRVSRSGIRPGDLVFYETGRSRSDPGHVGLAASNQEVVDAAHNGLTNRRMRARIRRRERGRGDPVPYSMDGVQARMRVEVLQPCPTSRGVPPV
ncbi:NlpC/P60 family protein [[Actinomadura] parvosata]|uniref:NlpC/P60 family protein n=1 Tax=[Actinomadura] parvosata TaxID=1955412 RepID=UPI00406C203F